MVEKQYSLKLVIERMTLKMSQVNNIKTIIRDWKNIH